MRKIGYLAALACLGLAVACKEKADEALAAIQEFYESGFQTEMPTTERFDLYDLYESDFDVWSRSQDTCEPENVTVVKHSGMKNAYDVSFTQWDYETTLTIVTTGSTGDWKVDNILYDQTPVFDYSKPIAICFDITAYPLSGLLTDFIWTVKMNGKDAVMKLRFDEANENEEECRLIGTFDGKETRGVIKQSDGNEDDYAELDVYTGDEIEYVYFVKPVITDDYDIYYALILDDEEYRMEITGDRLK